MCVEKREIEVDEIKVDKVYSHQLGLEEINLDFPFHLIKKIDHIPISFHTKAQKNTKKQLTL